MISNNQYQILKRIFQGDVVEVPVKEDNHLAIATKQVFNREVLSCQQSTIHVLHKEVKITPKSIRSVDPTCYMSGSKQAKHSE